MKKVAKYVLPPLAVIVLCAGVVVWYEVRLGLLLTASSMAFKDVFSAAADYRRANGHWPRQLVDLELAPDAYTDLRTGKPFAWCGDRNVYINASASGGGSRQVLMSLSAGYREHLWSFRELRTYVLVADGGVRSVSLDDIYEETSGE